MHGFPADLREVTGAAAHHSVTVDPGVVSSRIGHRFLDPELLRRALTHRSYGATHNERLEYLGDSIVNCIIALELYARFPELSEGELSRLRANLVNQQALHRIALNLRLGEQLLLGDGGFDAAQGVVRRLFADSLAAVDPNASGKDAKTLLQELTQGKGMALPSYTLLATQGHAHAQTFQVQCAVDSLGIRTDGQGSSRRAAEQDAARKAYALATRA
jgi:ribonuclease III